CQGPVASSKACRRETGEAVVCGVHGAQHLVDSTRASYFFFEMAAPHSMPRGHNPFQQRVSAAYDALPPQLRLVGQWVMDHPREVALLSTREQARRIAVPATRMTSAAQRPRVPSCDDVRRI